MGVIVEILILVLFLSIFLGKHSVWDPITREYSQVGFGCPCSTVAGLLIVIGACYVAWMLFWCGDPLQPIDNCWEINLLAFKEALQAILEEARN